MGSGASKVYVSSYLFDRGEESRIISDDGAISWDSNPYAYKTMAEKVRRSF